MYVSGNTIGGMSGRILATIVSGELGWQTAVLVIGIQSLLLGLIFWKFFPESRFSRHKTDFIQKFKQMRRFLSDPYMLRLYGIAALLMGVFVSVYNYLTFRPKLLHSHYTIFLLLLFSDVYFWRIWYNGYQQNGKRYAPENILKFFIISMFIGVFMLFSKHIYILITGLALLTFSFLQYTLWPAEWLLCMLKKEKLGYIHLLVGVLPWLECAWKRYRLSFACNLMDGFYSVSDVCYSHNILPYCEKQQGKSKSN